MLMCFFFECLNFHTHFGDQKRTHFDVGHFLSSNHSAFSQKNYEKRILRSTSSRMAFTKPMLEISGCEMCVNAGLS